MSDIGFEAAAAPAPQPLSIRFTGSGSEYFRIWIVNLLLMLVTLGIYFPWAKVRRLRYFYANTLIGGQPLGFHASPSRMLRGYVLVALMLMAQSAAEKFSPLAGAVALVLLLALWPALLKSALQFRLANTSWRGLRFRFTGSVAGAYAALLPFVVPFVVLGSAAALVPDGQQPPPWFALLLIGVVLVSLAAVPWAWWRLKKYQHDHYAYGPDQTTLRARASSFYGVFMRTSGVALLTVIGLGVLVGLFAVAAILLGIDVGFDEMSELDARMLRVLAMVAAFWSALIALQFAPRAFFTSRMQNLLWSQTASPVVGFASTLRFRALFALTLKNWLLIILTLGLYWPFAAVALQRRRVEAVDVLLSVDPQALADSARRNENDAAGEAAGDLFGLDIGL